MLRARMTERRATLAVAGLYAVLAILLVGQGLLPDRTLSPSDYLWTATPWSGYTPHGVRLFGANGELADAVAAFQPFTQHARAVLPSGPLWDPDVSAGRPFLANMQSGVLSPFNVPSYVLPFWFSLAVVAALKLLAAAFGTFLLARALGMRPWAATAGGAGVRLQPVHGHVARVAAVERVGADAVAAAGDRPRDAAPRRDRSRAAGAGHGAAVPQRAPRVAFHVGVAAVLFGALRLSRAPGVAGAAAGLAVLGLAAGTLLAAIVMLPFLELVHHSGDLAERANRDPGAHPPRLRAVAGDARVLGPADAGDARAVHQRPSVLRGRAAAAARG